MQGLARRFFISAIITQAGVIWLQFFGAGGKFSFISQVVARGIATRDRCRHTSAGVISFISQASALPL